ncbi:hypothetical protein AM588_10010327 [Phytophthora nicotianae]|uniref:Expansin-like EG45 domain-containing protein n=1 Tax=Phytophthora nicotianae TaxID=4792 RepID=A0A0W8DUI7_PHYNI|nr:hypothetical protein AM588_10010327 [Phytophthora nicotianae]
MRGWTVIAAAAMAADAASASGAVSVYNISDPMYGTCRLKGISESSDNFKFYASVPSKDYALNEACARCITITRDDDSTKTTTAYVLDVCDGCASGTVQLSGDAMAALELDTTDTTTKVSYQFDTCPTSLMSGDIKACLMDGASATYVPLQFYNSQKVITGVTIDGVTATSTSSTFLYSANSGSSSSTWYKSVEFSVTSDDGETLNSSFAFTSTSGCATSSVQFNSASTENGVDGSTISSSSSSAGAIIGGVCGAVGALLIIVGSVILIRRRNPPTYAYSNSMATSPRRSTVSNVKTVPTLSAPVVPRQASGTNFHQYDDDVEEDRSSFDIDDMRESEARATSTDNSRRYGSQAYAPYSAADPYAVTVTSPQSNVRATSLRRPSTKQNSMRSSGRESGRYNNESMLSEADSYASAPRQTNQSILSNSTGLQSGRSNAPDNYSFSARPSMPTETTAGTDSVRDSYASGPASQNMDLSASQHSLGSMRESGGYSRESLSILGYPYSKKSGRHHNTTG